MSSQDAPSKVALTTAAVAATAITAVALTASTVAMVMILTVASTAILVAALILIVIAIIYWVVMWVASLFKGDSKDNFGGPDPLRVLSVTKEVFDSTDGAANFSEYKTQLPEADPVLYTDAKRLWAESNLTIDEVKKVL